MAQRNLDEVLKMVDLLTPEEQELVAEQLKMQWLRREVQKGIDQAARGELVDGDEAFAELNRRYQKRAISSGPVQLYKASATRHWGLHC